MYDDDEAADDDERKQGLRKRVAVPARWPSLKKTRIGKRVVMNRWPSLKKTRITYTGCYDPLNQPEGAALFGEQKLFGGGLKFRRRHVHRLLHLGRRRGDEILINMHPQALFSQHLEKNRSWWLICNKNPVLLYIKHTAYCKVFIAVNWKSIS